MKHILYLLTTGQIEQLIERPNDSADPTYADHYGCYQVDDDFVPELYKVDITVDPHVPILLPPSDGLLVNWEDIKNYRNIFEQVPVQTSYGDIDVDAIAMERLAIAIKQYLFLPTLQNGKLAWKMADNSIQLFNQVELSDLYEQADKARSVRAACLHVKAEQFNAMDPAPTIDFISKLNNWTDQS